jgi:hypothetical protein
MSELTSDLGEESTPRCSMNLFRESSCSTNEVLLYTFNSQLINIRFSVIRLDKQLDKQRDKQLDKQLEL